MEVDAPKFDLHSIVKTDEGPKMVMRRDYCESRNLEGKEKRVWIYYCARFADKDGRITTTSPAYRYTESMLSD